MPLDCNLPTRICIFEAGLKQALEHKWHESRRYGEDLGLLGVRDWCRRHWPTFQRFRRLEHLFGEIRYVQFPDDHFGLWHDRERFPDTTFDLVLGTFECGMENLGFVEWVRNQGVGKEEAYNLFTDLDPNCVRMSYDPIIEMAKRMLVPA